MRKVNEARIAIGVLTTFVSGAFSEPSLVSSQCLTSVSPCDYQKEDPAVVVHAITRTVD